MNKTALAAAVIIGGASTAASAAEYGFYSSSGSPYCDGIKYSKQGGLYIGNHVGNGCTEGDYAGGIAVKIPMVPTLNLVMMTEEYSLPDGQEIFVLDTKALTWTLYLEDNTYSIPFELANSGLLEKGPPGISHIPGEKARPAAFR